MMATRVTEAVPEQEQRLAMSYDEWLSWAGESTQSEWVDGEAIVFMPPKAVHALTSVFLVRLLADFVDLFDLGRVIDAPFEMRLPGSAREPDIMFVAREHLDRLTPERLVGPADLVVELISDDSVRRDRIQQLAEYGAAGVPEYWLFDPRPGKHQADFYQLADDAYRTVLPEPDGRYWSAVLPGFWLKPEWLWEDPLPSPFALLPEIAPEAVRRALERPMPGGEASRSSHTDL